MVVRAPEPAVTGREAEVLALVAGHLTNAEIAADLHLSVRTVESHVSSLIRKLRVTDRRSLARQAGTVLAARTDRPRWPPSLTSFVGRRAECAALADAVAAHRMVTVTGPGGVGKTRLAVQVAQQLEASRRDRGWFVDLVQVTDPGMVVAAVATAIGIPEQQERSLDDAVVAALAPSDGVLVLDNCEHLLDAVRSCVEGLLGACPLLSVLATSRARLATAVEWVHPLAGLPVTDAGGDAATLFVDRARAAGARTVPDPAGVADLCRGLDGLPLAIELAAARYPSLGLDGIRAGLGDGLRSLASGRLPERHGSMHDAIGWSVALLEPGERALLRAVSVFASWFDVHAAAFVTGVTSGARVSDGLGRLAERSLLVASPGDPTRYRALELIRQFSWDELTRLDADGAVHARHRQWCLDSLARLAAADHDDDRWCELFDTVAADVRAAIVRACVRADPAVPELAEQLAGLLLLRGQPAESQSRYEQAAEHASGPERPRLLRLAAGAAAARMTGNEALRLLHAAAREAVAAGSRTTAAQDLAWTSIYTSQAPGIMAAVPTQDVDLRVLQRAEALAGGSPAAQAAVATARAARVPDARPDALAVVARAVDLAAAAGLPLVESAALDRLTSQHLARHAYGHALQALHRRGEVLARVPLDAASAFQVNDYLLMASEVHLAVGDLPRAADYADRLAGLACYRQQHHLGLARRIKVEALTGALAAAAAGGERFLSAWDLAGRPVASNLAPTSYALAMVHGLLGDEVRRRSWTAVTHELAGQRPTQQPDGCASGWAPSMDALVALDRGRPDLALERLAADIDDREVWARWNTALWRPWYAALWAEAATLGGDPDAESRLRRSRAATAANPIATAVVDRTADLARGDGARLDDHARRFAALGCTYQERRTRDLQRAL